MDSDQYSRVASGWCLVIPAAEAHRAVALRHHRDVEACVVDNELWIRGKFVPDDERELLRLVPGARVFLLIWPAALGIAADNADAAVVLVPLGNRIPSGLLPTASWRPLTEHVQLIFPAARSSPPQRASTVALQFVRSSVEQVPNVFVVDIDAWVEFVTTAPAWRLERWSFAAAEDQSILVRGLPLPPLPGTRYVERDGIAVPAGWTWHPPVSSSVLRRVLQLEVDDMALIRESESWQLVRPSDWVRASRSAVQLTMEAMLDPT